MQVTELGSIERHRMTGSRFIGHLWVNKATASVTHKCSLIGRTEADRSISNPITDLPVSDFGVRLAAARANTLLIKGRQEKQQFEVTGSAFGRE